MGTYFGCQTIVIIVSEVFLSVVMNRRKDNNYFRSDYNSSHDLKSVVIEIENTDLLYSNDVLNGGPRFLEFKCTHR